MENRNRDKVNELDNSTSAGRVNRETSSRKGQDDSNVEFGKKIGQSEGMSDGSSRRERSGDLSSSSGRRGSSSSGMNSNDSSSDLDSSKSNRGSSDSSWGDKGSTGSSSGRH